MYNLNIWNLCCATRRRWWGTSRLWTWTNHRRWQNQVCLAWRKDWWISFLFEDHRQRRRNSLVWLKRILCPVWWGLRWARRARPRRSVIRTRWQDASRLDRFIYINLSRVPKAHQILSVVWKQGWSRAASCLWIRTYNRRKLGQVRAERRANWNVLLLAQSRSWGRWRPLVRRAKNLYHLLRRRLCIDSSIGNWGPDNIRSWWQNTSAEIVEIQCCIKCVHCHQIWTLSDAWRWTSLVCWRIFDHDNRRTSGRWLSALLSSWRKISGLDLLSESFGPRRWSSADGWADFQDGVWRRFSKNTGAGRDGRDVSLYNRRQSADIGAGSVCEWICDMLDQTVRGLPKPRCWRNAPEIPSNRDAWSRKA